jgi:hypothetical protein
MEQVEIIGNINNFEMACDEASRVCAESDYLKSVISEAPEKDLNNTTMQVLNQAIESMKARSGVEYNKVALEGVGSLEELKAVSMEGLKEFVIKIWQSIKNAFTLLYNKIKEFFTSNERKAAELKKDIDKVNKDFKDIEKDVLKADKETVGVKVEILGPSPYLIHKSLYKGSGDQRQIDLHTTVSNLADYAMKSREHHLMEYVRDFKEDILSLVDGVNAATGDSTIVNQVYAILNNYVSEKKLTSEQVANIRKHKDLETVDEFDSEYGNKRYNIRFSIAKSDQGDEADVLNTDQVISKIHTVKDISRLDITGVEVQDGKHLANALSDNYDELINYVKISRELTTIGIAVQGMISDIENKTGGDINSNHVVTLTVVSKAINAIVKLFSVMQGDTMQVLKEHTALFDRFNRLFKEQLLA